MPQPDYLLYTLGHSNHPWERFVDLLHRHRIQVVADVRSQPFSRLYPWYNADHLAKALKGAGLKYVPMGEELGGRPRYDEDYDQDGHADYARMAQRPSFRQGLERIRKGMRTYRIALLCSEEDPNACHRRLLIVRVLCLEEPELADRIGHIRGDGSVVSERELAEAEASSLPLFGEVIRPWRSPKSIRSASLAKTQRSSLKP